MPLPTGPLQRLLASLPPMPVLSPVRLAMLGGAVAATVLGVGILASGVFGHAPARLNAQIEAGDAAKALSTLEEKLASSPEDPTWNLLTIKARLALCQQRNCVQETAGSGSLPTLLASLPKLAANVTGPVEIEKKKLTITLEEVFLQAMDAYQTAKPQPESVLALYTAAPAPLHPQLAPGLFRPALTLVRKGEDAQAAVVLNTLAKAQNLPNTYTYAAGMLSGMLGGNTDNKNTNLIALRSVGTPPLPATAAALIPWAIKTDAIVSGTAAAGVLETLPQRVDALNLQADLENAALPPLAGELVSTSQLESATKQWSEGWQGTPQTLKLALQRTALMLDPNQPALWSTYLPALVSATQTATSESLAGLAGNAFTFKAIHVNSATTPAVAGQVISAAKQLLDKPGIATPLVMFASHLSLSKQQTIDLEKLSQAMLLKAAEQGDVTSTVVLAQTLPGVAQNNRQAVVPLLVKFIRDKLREGDFEAATNTADLLTNTLQMDVEFAPLVLEEFADDLKRRKIPEQLAATTPENLLLPQDQVVIDLGPLFTFMQSYFEKQPKVITAQLTTLVAEAGGTYGQANAMYLLGPSFPAETLPPEKQQEWLASNLEQALLADTSMDASTLASTAARLSQIHPMLNLAPIIEAALGRTQTLEEQRALWQSASPQVKEVFRAIRPEFTAFMQGVDALAAGRLNSAAQSLATITTPQWRVAAQPFLDQFNEKLLALSGVYVPVSAAPSFKTAAIIIAPQGLTGGKLTSVSVTFISRIGTLAEVEPGALRTNNAATHRFSVTVPYNFDTRLLTLSAQTIAQTSNGGTFNATYGNLRSLKLQSTDATGGQPSSVLTVTSADGSSTPFVRTLVGPDDALRPDGTYAIQSRLTAPVSATQGILPPGSMLTLATDNTFTKPPAGADTSAALVMPLTGTIRHPASSQPIDISGYFEPDTLTSTFIFNYPLPQSAQPAKAAVRCQTLAGPITCGSHNLNSARQAYAAMVTGLQTRESLAASTASRGTLNSLATAHILTAATPKLDVSTTKISATATVTSTHPAAKAQTQADDDNNDNESLPTESMPTTSAVTPSPTTVSATAPISGTTTSSTTAPSLLAPPELDDTGEAPIKHTPLVTSSEPEPGAFVNHSGASKKTSGTTPSPTIKP